MTPSFRAAVRFLGLDAHPDREDVLGSPWDLVLFVIGISVLVALLAVRPG